MHFVALTHHLTLTHMHTQANLMQVYLNLDVANQESEETSNQSLQIINVCIESWNRLSNW